MTDRILSTAKRHRWLALYEGVKIGERVVGYAADECKRITALYGGMSEGTCDMKCRHRLNSRLIGSMELNPVAVDRSTLLSRGKEPGRIFVRILNRQIKLPRCELTIKLPVGSLPFLDV